MTPSIWQLLIVLVIVLLLFGRGKIPQLMGDMAKGIKSFKRGMSDEEKKEDKNMIENGIHVNSGLVVDDGYELVLRSCGSCHSYKLVTQNNADAAGWTETIRWMQETQKLWDLGANEPKIVAYLAKNYGPKKKFRRKNLGNVEWFELD